MKIQKRDGREVEFDSKKIEVAILKAFKAVDGDINEYSKDKAHNISEYIYNECKEKELSVEQIQDLVEDGLMRTKRKDVAKAYILYRDERNRERLRNTLYMKAIAEKLGAKNVLNQNANVDEYSFGGRKGEADSIMMKNYALDYIMSDMSRKNHLLNIIYIHDLDSYAVGMHNCFQRNTHFITDRGIKSFEEFNDGDKIKVLDLNGIWRDATVKYYGRQPMKHITFERCGIYKEVNCTADHRWILKDGSVTTNLSIGDSLYPLANSTDFQIETQRDAEMFCMGFIIGDGVDHYPNNNNILKMEVRLCGEKVQYAPIFESAFYRKSNRNNIGNDLYYVKNDKIGKQSFLTNKLWNILTLREKIALFNGYLAADGSKTTNTKKIWTSDERVLEMIKDLSGISGYHIFNIKEILNSTDYKENRLLYEITFTKSYSINSTWKVVDIKNQPNKDYEAWCIEEPITHSFTLEGGMVTGNCLSFPFDKILSKGFNTRQTDIRPANSVNTAFQLVAVCFQLQSLQQFGGVSATHIDWTMVPFIRKSFLKHYIIAWLKDSEDFQSLDLINMLFEEYDEIVENNLTITRNKFEDWVDTHKKIFFDKTGLSEKDFYIGNKNLNKKYYQSALYDTIIETQQAVEGMYHNLNTLQSRSGNQLPFTSINYGTCTLPEGRLVIKALLEGSIKGVGKLHKTAIFPCGIFQCMKKVNRKLGDPNYDMFKLAIKSTSKRLYPNYANVDWSGNAGYDINDPKTYFSTMGCRTANGYDINGFGQLKDGRGNICPVTIIMPTLAMEADRNVDKFMNLLDEKIHEAKDMLIERFEYICSQDVKSAKFMYENGTMEGYIPEEGIRSALKHGTLALGQLGLAETLQLLIGCDHTEEKGMELAKRIEQLFKDRCAEFKQEYKLNFGVYYTPAENLCYTAMNKFKEKYGIIENVSDKDYFTNSTHVPVWKEIDPFTKIDIESELTGYSSAGCITYVEFDASAKNNLEALEAIINYAMDKDIPYFAINVPNDTCLDCGYTDELGDTCPICGSSNIQRLRRVTGYLTGDYKSAFNKGKQQETEMRFKHSKKLKLIKIQ